MSWELARADSLVRPEKIFFSVFCVSVCVCVYARAGQGAGGMVTSLTSSSIGFLTIKGENNTFAMRINTDEGNEKH